MARTRHFIAAGLLFGVLFAYAALTGYLTLGRVARGSSAGWMVEQTADALRVVLVRPGGPAVGSLAPGDELISIDGQGVSNFFDVRDRLLGRPPDSSYRVVVRREGRLLERTLRTEPYGLSWTTVVTVTPWLVSVLFLLFGFAVVLLRPDDRRAWLLALMCALMIPGDHRIVGHGLPLAIKAFLLFVGTLSSFFWPVFLHFFLVFPEPGALVRRFPRLTRWIYLPVLVLLVPITLAFYWMYFEENALAWGLLRGSPTLEWVLRLLPMAYVGGGLAALLLNYREASRVARRKLRVAVAGTLAGFGPFVLCLLLSFFVDMTRLNPRLLIGLVVLLLLNLLLMPLSFAYAILRHQVIPVRLIVRRGIRYLLVARGFFLIEALVLLAALGFVLSGRRAEFLDRLGERADIAATLLVSGLVIGLLTLLHRRVMPSIDRRFFRAEYDAQKVLGALGDAARHVRDVDELLDVAAQHVGEALHPESLGVFLLEEASGHYRCVLPREGGAALLRPDAGLLEALRRSPAPRETDSGGLILPIVAKGDLLGLLSLGPRLGDLPYAREDRRLLEAVAWQLAFAIENARLVRRMVEEERLRRELALASEVQRRLFPERPPAAGALDLAGVCYPAQGVGGDYYDFLELGGGRLGLAVADVAGKGISAALLMSIVQASLRSHARDGEAPLTELVASMNRLLYRSTARNSFASFFYARFDPARGTLCYVNAGHNPPLVARARGAAPTAELGRLARTAGSVALVAEPLEGAAALEFLKPGGIVLGATENASYVQETVRLAPGDLLVAYTDGVTEAFGPGGEEFGEQRLCDVVLAARPLAAQEIADRVVRSVREWCREAPQTDDLTLIVAKVR